METNLIPHTQIPEISSDPSLLTQQPNFFGQDRTFSRREKAAMVIGLMMQQGVDLPLSRLPSELQSELTELIGELHADQRGTVRQGGDEFDVPIDRLLHVAEGLGLAGGGPIGQLHRCAHGDGTVHRVGHFHLDVHGVVVGDVGAGGEGEECEGDSEEGGNFVVHDMRGLRVVVRC